MRILHILDHSLPLHSGYTFRTLAILRQQRALGWHTMQLTSAKQGQSDGAQQLVDGWHFYRTAPAARWWARLPVLRQAAVIIGLAVRLRQLAQRLRPDILHAHSPVLNAIAALNAGRALGIPVVYEVRAFWEDAAADHGSSPPGGLRYRLTRALETYALRRADAVTTICDACGASCARAACRRTRSPSSPTPSTRTPSMPLIIRPWPVRWVWKATLSSVSSARSTPTKAWPCCCAPCRACWPPQPALRLLLAGGGPSPTAHREA